MLAFSSPEWDSAVAILLASRHMQTRAGTGPAGGSPLVVTGAAGFVGSRFVPSLASLPVRALARGHVDHLPPDVPQVEVDLVTGSEALRRAFDGARAVVHLAGHNETVARRDPDRALTETAVMARHVADAATAAGVERIVYLSTVHVYGDQVADGAVLTEQLPPEPRSTYAITRLACEHLLAQADAELVVLRMTNAVGAPADPSVDRWTLVAADLCRQAVTHGTLQLRTAGLQWRDFVDLGDVCRILRASTDPATVDAGVYNLASGRSHTIRHVAEIVQDTFEQLTGTRPPLQAPDPTGPEPAAHHVSVDALAAQGLGADTPVAESIGELARFCLDHKEGL